MKPQDLEFVFPPSSAQQEFQVDINLVDDLINELNEGFFLLIELDPTNNETALLDRNGLALITIGDNDRKNCLLYYRDLLYLHLYSYIYLYNKTTLPN